MRRSGFGMPTLRSASMPAQSRLLLADRVVEEDRLDDLGSDRVHGTEGGHRLLKDETDVAASNRTNLPAVGLELDEVDLRSVGAGENDLAVDDAAGTIDDPQDRLRRDALSAAALADDAQRLAREDVEGSAVDGFASFPRPERSSSSDSAPKAAASWSFCMSSPRIVERAAGAGSPGRHRAVAHGGIPSTDRGRPHRVSRRP